MDENLKHSPLWPLLVETAHALPLYKSHKGYIRDNLLVESPNISPEKISERLGMPLGETLVVMEELKDEKQQLKSY